jgi:hypothetical protein
MWAAMQVNYWQASYEEMIDPAVPPGSQGWMSGRYDVLQEPGTGPVKIYLEKDQLYMLRPNQLPIELYPAGPDTVFHYFLNGFELTFTFRRNLWGQVTGAQGTFGYEPYNISLPYDLTRPGVASYNMSLVITSAVCILLILFGSILFMLRRRKSAGQARDPGLP